MYAKEIETKAQKVLSGLNLSAIPVPVEEIAKKYDIEISDAPSKEFSGILIRRAGKSLLGVNSKENDVRQRFTIAHELGHYFLHSNRDVFVEYRESAKTFKDKNKKKPYDIKEVQANAFAAALLMPKDQIEKDFTILTKKGIFEEHHITMLARKYDVSELAMNFRLINLKLSQK